MFRLPCSLDPPIAPTAVVTHGAAGPFTPRNGPEVAPRNCGIATCLNRATDTAGLSPAGPWPCRPLPSGRSMARAPVAEGFQRHPFRYHVAWVHSSAWVTFPQAPLSSRTVGFPESGWQQQLSPEDLPRHPEAQALARVRPWDAWLYLQLDTDRVLHRKPGSVSRRCLFAVPATYREPLRPQQALPAAGWRPAPPRRALPPLHRSYGLMRPTKLLSLTSALAYTASPCRLPRAPAGGWWFPTLSPQSVRRCLDPYPVAARPVHLPASSRVASASQ